MNKWLRILLGLPLVGIVPARAQTPVPSTGEFQINTYTTYFQLTPDVTTGSDGGFLVVWSSSGSYGTDSSSTSIQGQRFDSAVLPIGGEFQVNGYTSGSQREPAVASGGPNGFVVVWDSVGSVGNDISQSSIQGQRLDATGDPVGSQFQVNTYTSSTQEYPDVAVAADGGFVVVWQSLGSAGSDTDGTSIQGRRFDMDGNPIGAQFQVNSYTPSFQLRPEVAMQPGGDFLIVWHSLSGGGADTSGPAIGGKRYDSMGVVLGSEFLVNSYTTDSQIDPTAALAADGGFVVAWGSPGGSFESDDSYSSIQGQRFDGTGMLEGGQFQVNSNTSLNQVTPAVASVAAGDFVVAWEDFNSPTDGSYAAVEAQRYDAQGARVGVEFEVNTYTTHLQHEVSVALQPTGDFLIVWESRGSFGSDSSYTSIQGRLYASPFFADGFESGDARAWSEVSP